MIRALLLTTIGLLLHICSIRAQDFNLLETQGMGPAITSMAFAFDGGGTPVSIPANELTATVNGTSAQVASAVEQPANPRNVSVVVCIDASESMSSGGNTGLMRASDAAKAIVALLGANDEVALVQFSDRPTILHGLTTDKSTYEQAVDNLRPGFGSNVATALIDPTMGALSHASSATSKRVVLFITDANNRFDATSAMQLADAYQAQVYVIGIDAPSSVDLQLLALTSGGAALVSSGNEVSAAAMSCIAHAKRLLHTRIDVSPPVQCLTNRSLAITRGAITRQVDAVSDQTTGVSTLEWSEPGLEFGAAGQPGDKSVRLTARGSAITISAVSISSPEFQFQNAISPGTVINEDEFLDLVVRYSGSPRGVFAEITVSANACPTTPLYCRGGSLTSGKVLEVTAPSGGESFVAGTTTTIEWTNTLPQHYVSIDFSADGGSTWMPLTESASGNSWDWITGPETTTGGKVRVQRTVLADASVEILNGHIGPVYSSAVLADNYSVVTGGQDGTVRLWSIEDGSYIKQLGTHIGWVWTLAAHPNENVVASGSHDGSVRVWDASSGIRRGTYLADSRVWTVSFSPDGSLMAVGSENSLTLVSYPALSLIRTVNLQGSRVQTAKFSPDGTLLVVGEGSSAAIRRVSDLSVLQRFSDHTATVYTATFSPDGQTAYSGGADRQIMSWEVATGTVVSKSAPLLGSVLDLDISFDGATILSSSVDATAASWTAANLTKVYSFAGHSGSVYSAQFNATASKIVTASSDQTGRVWDISEATVVDDVSSSTFSIVGGQAQVSNLGFGEVTVLAGREQTTTFIENTGTTPLLILSARVVEGDVDHFSIAESVFPVTINASERLNLSANFSPLSVGAKTATVQFDIGTGTIESTLSGTGIQPALSDSKLQPSPSSQILDFGRIIAGQAIRDSLITLRLSGTDALAVVGTSIRGEQGAAFDITEGSGSATITPAAPRNVRVQFAPPSIGAYASELVLELDNGSEFVVRLYGEGTGSARIFSTNNTLLFQTAPCDISTRTESVPITNTGGTILEIRSIGITGKDADEFTFTNVPSSIAPSETYNLEVQFSPTNIGVKDAAIVVTTNGIGSNNGTLNIPIIARQDATGFELSVTNIVFNNVNEGEVASQQVNLINTGTTSIAWAPAPINLGDFTIVSIEPAVTAPGTQSAVTIRFNGGMVNQDYDGSYTFTEAVCGLQSTLTMSAEVRSYIGCTIDIDSVGTNIGTTVSVPVRITNRVNFERTSITSIGARLSVNGTILTPTNGDKGTFLPTGTRTFDVTIPIPADGEVASVLQFETTWGNDTGTVIRIDSVWVDDTVVVRNDPGYVRLNDLCRQGGPRLFLARDERGEGIKARVIPHPVTTGSTIDLNVVENGPTKMELVDLNGRILKTIVNRDLQRGRYLLPFDDKGLEAGTYVLVVQTRTQRLSNRISVVR